MHKDTWMEGNQNSVDSCEGRNGEICLGLCVYVPVNVRSRET